MTDPIKPNGDAHALVLRPSTAPSPYEPTSYEQALAMAATFADSKLCKVATAASAFMVMATGQSLGIPPETALRTFHVIDGTVTLPAQIMVGLCLRRPDICEYFDCIESDAAHAVYETKRKGRSPQRITYTIQQAHQAKLVRDGGNWQKDPEAMCCARASSRLARRVYPDILAGLYTMDEILDGDDAGPPIEAPAAPPTARVVVAPPAAAAPPTAAPAEAKFEAALRAAPDEAAGLVVGAAIAEEWPDKADAARKRLGQVFKQMKKDVWSKMPAHDPITGETEREPGAEG